MNILFYNTSDVSEIKGGTERITARISKGFQLRGHNCYLAYEIEIDRSFPLTEFTKKINVNKASLEKFIRANHIDIIIIQKMTRLVISLYKMRIKYGLTFKIYSVLHFMPGYELFQMNFDKSWQLLFHESTSIRSLVKNIIRTVGYPLYQLYYPKRDQDLYRKVYAYSDKVILLSKGFIDEYANYCGLKEIRKFRVIPNALSYDDFFPVEKLKEKQKQVLIVSRLEEKQKRISKALQIWSMVEQNSELDDWKLCIVGTGPDEEKYKQLSNTLQLKRVAFYGRQAPRPYYEQSSIFMMTSSHEGWGLTLTEAQQMGCVPIAFGTFAAVQDIIGNDEYGYIIPNNDLSSYYERLRTLMLNSELRIQQAISSINYSKKFELNQIVQLWEQVVVI